MCAYNHSAHIKVCLDYSRDADELVVYFIHVLKITKCSQLNRTTSFNDVEHTVIERTYTCLRICSHVCSSSLLRHIHVGEEPLKPAANCKSFTRISRIHLASRLLKCFCATSMPQTVSMLLRKCLSTAGTSWYGAGSA